MKGPVSQGVAGTAELAQEEVNLWAASPFTNIYQTSISSAGDWRNDSFEQSGNLQNKERGKQEQVFSWSEGREQKTSN